jgi:hypothetical protein
MKKTDYHREKVVCGHTIQFKYFGLLGFMGVRVWGDGARFGFVNHGKLALFLYYIFKSLLKLTCSFYIPEFICLIFPKIYAY